MAPGVSVSGASSTGAGLVTMSGTSMSTPHVAGAWAVLRSAFPNGQFDQMEQALKQTGTSLTRVNSGITVPKIQVSSAIDNLNGKDRRIFNNVVSSSARGLGQSFLRFFNNSASAGTVTVTLHDSASGTTLGTWTSPSIPPQASPQIAVQTIEMQAVPAPGQTIISTSRLYYNVEVASTFVGYMQHVLWAQTGGVFSNLSSCASGFADDASTIPNLHASTILTYNSHVRIVNTGTTVDHAVLTFYDSGTGAQIGVWTGPDMAAGSSMDVTAAQFEQQIGALGLAVHNGLLQYSVKLSNLSGYVQHVLENTTVGAFVDMSSKCDMGVAPVAAN